VSSDLQIKNPRVNVILDRDRAAALGVNWNNIPACSTTHSGPQFSSTIYSPTNQYRVLLEMLPQYQEHTDGLKMIYLKSDSGQLVAARCRGEAGVGCRPAEHSALRATALVTISFALRPGTSLGQATFRHRGRGQGESARHHHRHVPGHGKVFQDSMKNMGILLIVAIAVVYIVLGMLYESYVHPLTILSDCLRPASAHY